MTKSQYYIEKNKTPEGIEEGKWKFEENERSDVERR